MKNHGGAMAWCWAGLATTVLAGMALTQAEDLRSGTERILAVDLGRWLDWSELHVQSVRWQFAVTPFAAWWAVAMGGLCGWIGWKSHRCGALLALGWSGCLIWPATWGFLCTESLPLAWLFLSIQSWITVFWLIRQSEDSANGDNLWSFLASHLLADTCGLAGVLLAGIAWRTFDIAQFRDPEFVFAGWRQNPLPCSAAGGWLFLGFACRCLWFPWLPATRIGQLVSPWSSALIVGGISLPSIGWWWYIISPLLGCAPEVVAFVQAAGLLAALIAAFVATAQTDRRRTILLLVSMQFGLIASATILPGIGSPEELAIVIGAACLLAAYLLTSPNGWRGRWAWWLLAGGCLSPLFWTAQVSVERFPAWSPPGIEAADLADDPTPPEQEFRVRPLPTPSWVAAWCLSSFLAAFAARRAASENDSSVSSSHGDWLGISIATILAACAAWLAIDETVAGEVWPGVLAAICGLAGWSMASSLCRNAAEFESRFRRWGLWATYSQRSSILDDGVLSAIGRAVSGWSTSIRRTEDVVLPKVVAGGLGGLAGRLTAAVEELRNEPSRVYPVAFALVVGSMIATWMWLVHRP